MSSTNTGDFQPTPFCRTDHRESPVAGSMWITRPPRAARIRLVSRTAGAVMARPPPPPHLFSGLEPESDHLPRWSIGADDDHVVGKQGGHRGRRGEFLFPDLGSGLRIQTPQGALGGSRHPGAGRPQGGMLQGSAQIPLPQGMGQLPALDDRGAGVEGLGPAAPRGNQDQDPGEDASSS